MDFISLFSLLNNTTTYRLRTYLRLFWNLKTTYFNLYIYISSIIRQNADKNNDKLSLAVSWPDLTLFLSKGFLAIFLIFFFFYWTRRVACACEQEVRSSSSGCKSIQDLSTFHQVQKLSTIYSQRIRILKTKHRHI